MSWGWSSRRGRVLSRAGIGVLGWVIGPDLVDEAVGDGLAWEMRLRALPSRLGVYFVLGLCLFSDLPYGEVLRKLTCGLETVLAAAGWRVPASTALTAVRRRLGERPLESLFGRVCSALSPGRAPWATAGPPASGAGHPARAPVTARRPARARSCGWSRWWRAGPGACWTRRSARRAARAPASSSWPASCWPAWGAGCC